MGSHHAVGGASCCMLKFKFGHQGQGPIVASFESRTPCTLLCRRFCNFGKLACACLQSVLCASPSDLAIVHAPAHTDRGCRAARAVLNGLPLFTDPTSSPAHLAISLLCMQLHTQIGAAELRVLHQMASPFMLSYSTS